MAHSTPLRDIRRTIRVVITTVAITIFVGGGLEGLVQSNVQKLAEQEGWDKFLVNYWHPIMDRIGSFLAHPWVWNFAWFCAGIALALWLIKLFPERKSRTTSIDRATLEEITTFFNASIQPATEAGTNVLSRALFLMNQDPHEAFYAGLIERSIVDEIHNAFARLSNIVRRIEAVDLMEAQDCLGYYFRTYQHMRTYISLARERGFDLDSYGMFETWRPLDQKVLDAFRGFSSSPKYAKLLELLKQVGWGEGVTDSLRKKHVK